jgi:hypothetical protein
MCQQRQGVAQIMYRAWHETEPATDANDATEERTEQGEEVIMVIDDYLYTEEARTHLLRLSRHRERGNHPALHPGATSNSRRRLDRWRGRTVAQPSPGGGEATR